ncbi:MAG TPA: phosphoribosyltransferase family protein [Actinomycetota bacterium]
MIFEDRVEAGERLAKALVDYSGADAVILAIPRGGVIVGEVVARQLGVPLDVVVPRKIGAPGNPELGLGAIAPGVRVIDPRMVEMLGVSESYLERQIAAEEEEIERRLGAYRGGRPPADVAGKVAVVVDDGVATGGTAFAALRWAKAQGASTVVLAVPVAPGASIGRLEQEADRVVVLSAPEPFFAVGEWYRRFDQTTDEEVVAALARAAGRQG